MRTTIKMHCFTCNEDLPLETTDIGCYRIREAHVKLHREKLVAAIDKMIAASAEEPLNPEKIRSAAAGIENAKRDLNPEIMTETYRPA